MIKGYDGSLYGLNRMDTFSETWSDFTSFYTDYSTSGIPALLDTTSITTLYYLLYAKYAHSTIASSDVNQFKYQLFTTIWEYGPNWVKKLDIQNKLRNLTDEQLLEGSRQIYNHALNPSNDPTNFTDEELPFIDNQNSTKTRKGKLEGYALLLSLLEDDITEQFLRKFRTLFLTIVEPELPLYYITGEDE